MGKTNSAFRANAAYSLYGVLKEYDNSVTSFMGLKKKSKNMCNRLTYINSFFTTAGAELLSTALGTIETDDIQYATSYCTYEKDDSGSYTSMTMGCDAKGGFTYASFSGKYCEGFNFVENLHQMVNYTIAMEEDFNCLQVWDYDTYANSNNNNNNNHRGLNNDHNNNNNKHYGYGSIGEELLYYSTVCDLNQYPHDCPDPYGLKNMYDVNLLRAEAGLTPETPKSLINPDKPFVISTIFMFLLAIALVQFSYYVASESRKRRARRFFAPCFRLFGNQSDKEISDEEYDEEYDPPTITEVSNMELPEASNSWSVKALQFPRLTLPFSQGLWRNEHSEQATTSSWSSAPKLCAENSASASSKFAAAMMGEASVCGSISSVQAAVVKGNASMCGTIPSLNVAAESIMGKLNSVDLTNVNAGEMICGSISTTDATASKDKPKNSVDSPNKLTLRASTDEPKDHVDKFKPIVYVPEKEEGKPSATDSSEPPPTEEQPAEEQPAAQQPAEEDSTSVSSTKVLASREGSTSTKSSESKPTPFEEDFPAANSVRAVRSEDWSPTQFNNDHKEYELV